MSFKRAFRPAIVVWCALCALASCSDYSAITITNVKDVKVVPSGGGRFAISLNATITNPTRRRIKLKSATFNLYQNHTPFATLVLTQPIVAARRSQAEHSVHMEVQLQNILAALMGFAGLSADNLTISGKMVVASFPARRTLHIEPQPLKEFEAQFGNVFSSFLKN